MSNIYILIEQALGYCLLKVKHCKSIEELLVLLQDKNFENVKGKIKLAEFQPFSSVNNASLNCQDIANGNASEDLITLLKSHLCNGRCVLVLSDRKLLESLKAANINELLEFSADSSMIMNLRRVRFSIHEFMGDKEEHLLRAHIGLGHSFSRMKIKFNINRADNMIIQCINLMDQLDKDINTMAMRLREWFGYHYPELVKLVPDNRAYSTVVGIIGSRAGVSEDVLERLENAVGDSSRARQIITNAKTSMGYELTEEDFLNIGHLAKKNLSMMIQREDTAKYLASKMAQVAPNFSTLVGDIVAARLISHAGSLINLAKFPASTIQILGAEKALFRALKTRTNTPKYGLIFHSSFIGRAAKCDKGRISRFLAAKISLAVRLDCFMEEPMNIFGIHLRRQVEDQLKFLETGQEPRKNYEAMEEAVKDAKKYIAEMKEIRGENNTCEKSITVDIVETENKKAETEGDDIKRKKKKKEKNQSVPALEKPGTITEPEQVPEASKKKKKKSQTVERENVEEQITVENNIDDNLKKKKKRKANTSEVEEGLQKSDTNLAVSVVEDITDGSTKKKKKKTKEKKVVEETEVTAISTEVVPVQSKKKKKNKDAVAMLDGVTENGSKKSKKRSLETEGGMASTKVVHEKIEEVKGPSKKKKSK